MIKTIAVAFATVAALSIAAAQDAHADEGSFYAALAGDGLPITDSALPLGHQVCADILANGVAGVGHEIQLGLNVGMTGDDVSNFIGDAVTELCPAGIPAVKGWIATVRTELA